MRAGVLTGALIVAAINALAVLLGGARWYRGESPGRRAERLFWVSLRVGQASAVLFAIGIGGLAASGHFSSDRLFYLYALLPLAIGFVAEQLRVAAAETILERHELADAAAVGELQEAQQRGIVAEIVRRETGLMTLSSLVVVFLILRAAGTAHF